MLIINECNRFIFDAAVVPCVRHGRNGRGTSHRISPLPGASWRWRPTDPRANVPSQAFPNITHHDAVVAVSNLPRIIVLRTDTTQVFSGDFNGQSTTQAANSSTSPALQLTYSAPYSGLEVYSFNQSALSSDIGVSWSVGTPQQQQAAQSQELCNALVQQNPGKLNVMALGPPPPAPTSFSQKCTFPLCSAVPITTRDPLSQVSCSVSQT